MNKLAFVLLIVILSFIFPNFASSEEAPELLPLNDSISLEGSTEYGTQNPEEIMGAVSTGACLNACNRMYGGDITQYNFCAGLCSVPLAAGGCNTLFGLCTGYGNASIVNRMTGRKAMEICMTAYNSVCLLAH